MHKHTHDEQLYLKSFISQYNVQSIYSLLIAQRPYFIARSYLNLIHIELTCTNCKTFNIKKYTIFADLPTNTLHFFEEMVKQMLSNETIICN